MTTNAEQIAAARKRLKDSPNSTVEGFLSDGHIATILNLPEGKPFVVDKVGEGHYQTRDGRPVRVLCLDGGGSYPVVGLIGASANQWTNQGGNYSWSEAHRNDLIPVPAPERKKVFRWLILGDYLMCVYESKTVAVSMMHLYPGARLVYLEETTPPQSAT